VAVSARPTLSEQGDCLGVSGILNDVTERKKAEASLGESQNRLRLLNAIATGITAGTFLQEVINFTVSKIHEFYPAFRVSFLP